MNNLECFDCLHKNKQIINETLWDFVPLVVCISLKERPDRTFQSLHQFHLVGLCKKVLFYQPKKDLKNGVRGCWNSHITVIDYGYVLKVPFMLIFEDDILFELNNLEKKLQILQYNLNKLKKWDIFYIGQISLLSLPINKNIFKTFSLGTHAYFCNYKYMKKMNNFKFDNLKKKIPIDNYYMYYSNSYCFFPILVYQNGSKSSISRISWDEKTSEVITHKDNLIILQYLSLILPIFIILFLIILIILFSLVFLNKKY